jgi:hypothetical protein
MPQSPRSIFEDVVEYVANGIQTIKLKRGLVLRELYLNLSGQLTLAAASNTEAATLKGDEWAVVRRIRLIANGTDVLWDVTADDLWWINYYLFGVPPLVTPDIGISTQANPVFGPYGSAVAATAQASMLVLPLWMPRSRRPIDTALDTRLLSDLQLEITWGSHLSINAAATGFTAAPRIEVRSSSVFGLPENSRFASWRIFRIENTITSASPMFRVELPVQRMYRGFWLNTTDAGADVRTIINEIRLKSGPNQFQHFKGHELQAVTRLRQGIVRDFDPGAEGFDPLRRSVQSDFRGWYYMDLVLDGMLTEAIDTLGFVEFELEMDLNVGAGATKLIVIPSTIIPVRAAAA